MTSVVNVKSIPSNWKNDPQYMYIGRPSMFGNPVAIGKKCPVCGEKHMDGGSTLPCFKIYFDNRIETDLEFANELLKLKDKTLVCFCVPNPCHGNIIAARLDKE